MSKFSKTFNPTLKEQQNFALRMIKLITDSPISCHNCKHFLNLDKHNVSLSTMVWGDICDIDTHDIINAELEFKHCDKFEDDGVLLYWISEYVRLTNIIYKQEGIK